MAYPAEKHTALLKALESALSEPPAIEQAITSPVFISHAPLSEWMPIAAAQLIEGVRTQLSDCTEPWLLADPPAIKLRGSRHD